MNQIFSKIDIYCKIVHQVDRPDTIYKRPADIFICGNIYRLSGNELF